MSDDKLVGDLAHVVSPRGWSRARQTAADALLAKLARVSAPLPGRRQDDARLGKLALARRGGPLEADMLVELGRREDGWYDQDSTVEALLAFSDEILRRSALGRLARDAATPEGREMARRALDQ